MSTSSILLVDDNEHDLFLIQRVLTKTGIDAKIIVANDGIEALDYLFGRGRYNGKSPEQMPVVVLLDLKMPQVDGFEVLRQTRASVLTRNLPIVMLSSSTEESDIIRCYDLGCNAFVTKQIDYEQFFESIKRTVFYWLSLNRCDSST
jgi:two-component system, response regulator